MLLEDALDLLAVPWAMGATILLVVLIKLVADDMD